MLTKAILTHIQDFVNLGSVNQGYVKLSYINLG